jgi:hypothetical protein
MNKQDEEMFKKLVKTAKNVFFAVNGDYAKTGSNLYNSINSLYGVKRDEIMRDRSVPMLDRLAKMEALNNRIGEMLQKIMNMLHTGRIYLLTSDANPLDMNDKVMVGKFHKVFEMINDSSAYLDIEEFNGEMLVRIFCGKLIDELPIEATK